MPRTVTVALTAVALWLCLPTAFAQGGFGAPVKPLQVQALPLAEPPLPKELLDGAELHVIQGYEPTGGTVRVYIDRPGKSVILALATYEKTLWQVEALSGTRLAAIVVSSYERGTVVTTATPTRGFRMSLPYGGSDQAPSVTALRSWAGLLGAKNVDVFRGAYRIPSEIVISEPDPPRPDLEAAAGPQRSPIKLEFELTHVDSTRSKWSLEGPVGPTNAASVSRAAHARNGVYELSGEGLARTDRRGARVLIELPANFPRFSWPTAVAYDPDSDIVSVTTLGGEGFLYRYDAKQDRWLDYRSLMNVDIETMSYDPVAKRYVAWSRDYELLFIAPSGELQSKKPILRKPQPGDTAGMRRDHPRPPFLLVPRGNNVALLNVGGSTVSQIWLYRVDRDEAILTFAGRR